ncbi:hypothetical protein J6590_041226 [Homalodisca vitripennis]|nr:hypothetical protein J6590_041226 [Homalodisca vitripennis]
MILKQRRKKSIRAKSELLEKVSDKFRCIYIWPRPSVQLSPEITPCPYLVKPILEDISHPLKLVASVIRRISVCIVSSVSLSHCPVTLYNFSQVRFTGAENNFLYTIVNPGTLRHGLSLPDKLQVQTGETDPKRCYGTGAKSTKMSYEN